jgi:2'-5' RNA ligase
MRLFIGIALPADVRAQIAALCRTLKPAVPSAKWVAEDSLHLTLKFLGQSPSEMVPEVAAAMRRALGDRPPYGIRLDRLGMFPSLKRARVLWLGVSEGAQETIELSGALDAQLETVGFRAEERPCHPHITLARLRVPRPLAQLAEDASAGTPPVDAVVSVASVTLFESRLSRSGAQYFTVEEVPLGRV